MVTWCTLWTARRRQGEPGLATKRHAIDNVPDAVDSSGIISPNTCVGNLRGRHMILGEP